MFVAVAVAVEIVVIEIVVVVIGAVERVNEVISVLQQRIYNSS